MCVFHVFVIFGLNTGRDSFLLIKDKPDEFCYHEVSCDKKKVIKANWCSTVRSEIKVKSPDSEKQIFLYLNFKTKSPVHYDWEFLIVKDPPTSSGSWLDVIISHLIYVPSESGIQIYFGASEGLLLSYENVDLQNNSAYVVQRITFQRDSLLLVQPT